MVNEARSASEDLQRLDRSMTDQQRLERCREVATLMDSAISLPIIGGVGLDGIVGLLPIAGDWVTGLVGLYIVYQGYQLGLPTPTLLWMLTIVALDVVVGSVPLFGDAIDIVWKSNERNVARIERHVEVA